MEWLLLIVGGALGIPASMAATYLYGRISSMQNRRRLRIEGTWGEYAKDSAGHQFTLGEIYFDRKRGIYAFDGTNYANDGAIFCHFKTISSSVEIEARKYLYTFEAQLPGKMEVYFGFGVVNLGLHHGVLSPSDGHYVSASVDGKGMSHSMVPMADLTYQRDAHGGEIVKRMRAHMRAARVGTSETRSKRTGSLRARAAS